VGSSVFVVSVTLSFAEAEQRQANGPVLRFFLAEVAIGLGGRSDRTASKNLGVDLGLDERRRGFSYLSPSRESRTAAPNAAFPVHFTPLIYSSTHLHDCADEMIGRAIDACFEANLRL
jgi:hypothetical protein